MRGKTRAPSRETWMIRKAEIVPKGEKPERPVTIGAEVLKSGRFRALDLAPGDYLLRVALHESPPRDSCGWGRLLSEYAHEFKVPSGSMTSEIPLDLGTLEPIATADRPFAGGRPSP